MCGEHFIISARGLGKTGSSPHVRGAQFRGEFVDHLVGIIPACAGSTLARNAMRPIRRDHPRMCGEHADRAGVGAVGAGSSPHVRGAHVRRLRVPLVSGIIPACAGSTNSSMVFPVDKRDHPRMCGEHGRVVTVNGNVKGSSPHVRGAPAAVVVCHLVRGIIPACAGSTRRSWSSTACSGDHPRMCGEHVEHGVTPVLQEGSSPHVRGARFVPFSFRGGGGIIPACAGSTRAARDIKTLGRDHPRMCGEHHIW